MRRNGYAGMPKLTEIYEGTREIRKNTIARALIGKFD